MDRSRSFERELMSARSRSPSSDSDDEEDYPEVRAHVMELPPPATIFAGMSMRKIEDCYARAGFPNEDLSEIESARRSSDPPNGPDVRELRQVTALEIQAVHADSKAKNTTGLTTKQIVMVMEDLAKAWNREGKPARSTVLFGKDCLQVCGEILTRWHAGESCHADSSELAEMYPWTELGRAALHDDIQAFKNDTFVQAANTRFAASLGVTEEVSLPDGFTVPPATGCTQKVLWEEMAGDFTSGSEASDSNVDEPYAMRMARKKHTTLQSGGTHPWRRSACNRNKDRGSPACRRKYKTSAAAATCAGAPVA